MAQGVLDGKHGGETPQVAWWVPPPSTSAAAGNLRWFTALCAESGWWTKPAFVKQSLSAPCLVAARVGNERTRPAQVRVVGAQAGAQVDVNVRVTTGGAAAAAGASAQPNGRRPAESTQPNLAGFFGTTGRR